MAACSLCGQVDRCFVTECCTSLLCSSCQRARCVVCNLTLGEAAMKRTDRALASVPPVVSLSELLGPSAPSPATRGLSIADEWELPPSYSFAALPLFSGEDMDGQEVMTSHDDHDEDDDSSSPSSSAATARTLSAPPSYMATELDRILESSSSSSSSSSLPSNLYRRRSRCVVEEKSLNGRYRVKHFVASEDTIEGIAVLYDVEVEDIMIENSLFSREIHGRVVLMIPGVARVPVFDEEPSPEEQLALTQLHQVHSFVRRTSASLCEARLYLVEHEWDSEAALEAWEEDEAFVRSNPMPTYFGPAPLTVAAPSSRQQSEVPVLTQPPPSILSFFSFFTFCGGTRLED